MAYVTLLYLLGTVFEYLRCGIYVHSFHLRNYGTGFSEIWFSRQFIVCTCKCKMNAVTQRNEIIKDLYTFVFSKKKIVQSYLTNHSQFSFLRWRLSLS